MPFGVESARDTIYNREAGSVITESPMPFGVESARDNEIQKRQT